ncbi:unnamed protein product [Miscanthus lutarioriparius]|uniref:R13L1/DRL21-like LRR repeat region domain-containing protein n=1 Tax=Miscanthus lutarioriparius TaxID=422564 RepID=A0A811R020_9POAL|nr:unnamed protein product [Miscanthus lutarioriparius]
MEDVHKARLKQIKHLHKLTLEWDANRPKKDTIHEENVLEILILPSALKDLCIRGHGGTKCPQWLGENLSVKKLESLHLDGVAWNIFPPIGEFSLVNEPREEISNNNICHDKFQNLKSLELVMLPSLRSWIVKAPCHLFAQLEVLVIRDCRELTELSFSHYACCQQQKEAKINWFPRLRELKIKKCPKLLSFPPVPWTRAPCSAEIEGVGSGLEELVCKENYKSEYRLKIKMKGALVSELWNMLAFDNLNEVKDLKMDTCPPLPLHHIQMLSSLKSLRLYGASSIVFPLVEGERHAEYQSPVEHIAIDGWDASAKELTQLLTYFPKLSELNMQSYVVHIPLPRAEPLLMLRPADYSTTKKQDELVQEEGSKARWARATPCPLSNLASLTNLTIWECGDLRVEGLRHLLAQDRLTKLEVSETPNFFAGPEPPLPHEQEFPSSSSKLQELETDDVAGVLAAPICTLLSSSLTDLRFWGDEKVDRFTKVQEDALRLLTSLEEITFQGCDKLQGPAGLQGLRNLKRLNIYNCIAIRLLPKDGLPISLQKLAIDGCPAIRSLPKDCLPSSLQELNISDCQAIQSLPKDCLPSSLQELNISDCPAIQSLPKDCLPSSLQKLVIRGCPAIRSLPKANDLPSPLRELDVRYSRNEELRRQCRKLIGIIPVVYA